MSKLGMGYTKVSTILEETCCKNGNDSTDDIKTTPTLKILAAQVKTLLQRQFQRKRLSKSQRSTGRFLRKRGALKNRILLGLYASFSFPMPSQESQGPADEKGKNKNPGDRGDGGRVERGVAAKRESSRHPYRFETWQRTVPVTDAPGPLLLGTATRRNYITRTMLVPSCTNNQAGLVSNVRKN